MPNITNRGIKIEYEGFGDLGDPLAVLIAGFVEEMNKLPAEERRETLGTSRQRVLS